MFSFLISRDSDGWFWQIATDRTVATSVKHYPTKEDVEGEIAAVKTELVASFPVIQVVPDPVGGGE